MAKKIMIKSWETGHVNMLDIEQEFNVNDLNEEMQSYCMLHGFIQKLRDSIVSLGKGATMEDKKATILAMHEQLIAGDWFKQGVTRKKKVTKAVFFERALDAGYTAEQAQEQWDMFYEV